jgi:hypothetical protein
MYDIAKPQGGEIGAQTKEGSEFIMKLFRNKYVNNVK